jgi:hypothetical protein
VGEDTSRLPAKYLSAFYLHGTGYLISTWAFILHNRNTSLYLVCTSICHVADIWSTMSFSCCKIEQKKEKYSPPLYLKFIVRNLNISLPHCLSHFVSAPLFHDRSAGFSQVASSLGLKFRNPSC